MPKSKNNPSEKKTVRGITTRVRTALENTARQLQLSADGLPIASGEKPINVIVAFSGGLDSSVLLYAVSQLKEKSYGEITAVHVHHGLSKHANEWAEFCEERAKKCGVRFVLRKVTVPSGGAGFEAEARQLRYEVLEEEARKSAADAILTAHHLDDQLETFLIQWMRGSGPAGLAAMPPLLRKDGCTIMRPLLGFQRTELERFAEIRGIKWVEDESNEDMKYLRNAIRHNIIPELEKIRPGFKTAAARSIELIAEAAETLRDVAEDDFNQASENDGKYLRIDDFLALPAGRRARVLRLWLDRVGLKPLPRTRLLEMIRQIKETTKQSVCLMFSDGLEIRKYGSRLMVTEHEKPESEAEIIVEWHGEPEIDLPQYNGKLVFTPAEEGFNEGYLKAQPLSIRRRSGGEKIKIHKFRPRKALKMLFQEAGIPEFERKNLPLVWRGKTLIYVGGVGSEVREQVDDDGTPRYKIEFIKNPGLFS